jgi:hypothetical protein
VEVAAEDSCRPVGERHPRRTTATPKAGFPARQKPDRIAEIPVLGRLAELGPNRDPKRPRDDGDESLGQIEKGRGSHQVSFPES